VVALHGAAVYGLLSHRILAVPDEVVTLFVETIAAQTPPPREEPRPQPERPRKTEMPRPQQIVAQAPVVSPAEPVAAPPPPTPVAEAPPPRPTGPTGPVTLSAELSMSCPERTPPAYPPLSRRMGEEGKVVLRVEMDEQGVVSMARVATGSGFPRLDEAALAAVKTWRCTPARRDGQPVRAVALQPFKFILDGR
jgi:protein TonB